MNLDWALRIEGFTNPKELAWLAEQASRRHWIAEVGSWQGRGTRAMADNTQGGIWAIDTWKGTPGEHEKFTDGRTENWLLETFKANLHDHLETRHVQYVQGNSVEIARAYQRAGDRFDMIFIDADHSYDAVVADIKAWWPLLLPGGLLCGHDFDGGRPGVVKAVREKVPSVRMANAGSIWYAD